jgi:putative DNA primase/helicase
MKDNTIDRAPTLSDEDLALRFAELHAEDLRYVPELGRWYLWDGQCWRRDRKLIGFNNARQICRAAANESNDPDYRRRAVASAKTVAAVEKLARSDERIATTIDQWDANPWLLNTSDGVVNLKTGKLREQSPNDHMTKITAVGPDESGSINTWLTFLKRVTDEDEELQNYLQRILGYSLTGLTNEEALFFIYGPGANGKSVLIETVSGIMGNYAKTSPIETFTASTTDRHPTELARLHGARLVTATETEEGRRWAESRIKQLTGGDRVTARFMRQDFFEYDPQFKLIITGNHKPGLRSIDEATKRRVNMILFDVVIPAAERDKQLKRKLKREWPGILAWMIDGCVEWQEQGLNPPAVVTKASAEYLNQEDSFTMWVEERCHLEPDAWQPRASLFQSWSLWTSQEKKPSGTRPDFYRKLVEKGFREATIHGERGFKGLSLRS